MSVGLAAVLGWLGGVATVLIVSGLALLRDPATWWHRR